MSIKKLFFTQERVQSPVHKTSATKGSDIIDDDVITNENDITDETGDNGAAIVSALELVKEGVCHLVTLYCLSLLPGYLPEWWAEPKV